MHTAPICDQDSKIPYHLLYVWYSHDSYINMWICVYIYIYIYHIFISIVNINSITLQQYHWNHIIFPFLPSLPYPRFPKNLPFCVCLLPLQPQNPPQLHPTPPERPRLGSDCWSRETSPRSRGLRPKGLGSPHFVLPSLGGGRLAGRNSEGETEPKSNPGSLVPDVVGLWNNHPEMYKWVYDFIPLDTLNNQGTQSTWRIITRTDTWLESDHPPFIKPWKKGHVAPVWSLGPRRNCWAFSLFCGCVGFFVGTFFSCSGFFLGGNPKKRSMYDWYIYVDLRTTIN